MKKLLLVLSIVLIVCFIGLSIKADLNKETLICQVTELAGVEPREEVDFNIKNGSVVGTEHAFKIKVKFDKDSLKFHNLDNGAKVTMELDDYNGEIDQKDGLTYYSANHSFGFKEDNTKFIFSVYKANYNVDYLGDCKSKQ